MNRHPWMETLFRPLVIGTMAGCVALSLVGLVHLFAPAWNGTYLVVGAVLAALEANTSYRLIRARHLRGEDFLRFRGVELALFFILLKIGSYVGDSWASVLADVQTWPRQPWNILDPETSVAFTLAFFSWLAATQTAEDLERIGEPPEHDRFYVPPIERLTGRFFWGGAVLLVLAGITRIGLEALLNRSRPPVRGLVLNVLVYFLLGLVMLGQVHFTRLHQQWQAQQVRVARGLPGRWARYSLAFIGLAALLAFLLPTGYTVGLLDAVAALVGVLLYAVSMLVSLIVFLLSAVLAVLFGRERAARPEPALPPPPSPQPGLGGLTGIPGWLEILRSILFWAVTLGMVFYVIRSYLRDRPELLATLAGLAPLRALRDFLIALRRRLVGLAQAASARIPRRLSLRRARREPAEAPFRLFRLGALSPRERIRYYYLSTLRRAAQQGFPRQRAQTPDEYQATMSRHLPQAEQEVAHLTRAFVEARYSPHTFDQEQERQVRATWQRVKAALRALKHSRRDSSSLRSLGRDSSSLRSSE